MKKYSKFIVAVAGTILSAIMAAVAGDGLISLHEWINVAVAGTGALAVFTGPNVPGAKYTKAILSALTAMLVLLVSLIDGGLTTAELAQLAVAGTTAAGVYQVPNQFGISATC